MYALLFNSLSLASDSGSDEVFCLLRTTLLPPSPAGDWPVPPGVPVAPEADKHIELHWIFSSLIFIHVLQLFSIMQCVYVLFLFKMNIHCTVLNYEVTYRQDQQY